MPYRKFFISVIITFFVLVFCSNSTLAVITPSIQSVSPYNGQTIVSASASYNLHASFCVKGLASSFDYGAEYWITVDGNSYHGFYGAPGNYEYPEAYACEGRDYYLGYGQHTITFKAKNHLKVWWWEEVAEASQTVTINIVPPPVQFTLTVNSNGGTATVNGQTFSGSRSFSFAQGTSVNVSASGSFWEGNELWKFDEWNDGVTSSSRTVVMNSNKSLIPFYTCSVGCGGGGPIDP